MKTTFLSLIILLIAVYAYSQDNAQSEYKEWKTSEDEYVNFDIGKYFTPDIVRNQLVIGFGLDSDYSHVNSKNTEFAETSFRGVLNNNKYFAGGIASDFSRYVNTRRKISNLAINLSLNEDYTSRKQSVTYKDSVLNYVNNFVNNVSTNKLGIDWWNKWYFSKLFFLNYNVSGGISHDFRREEIKNPTTEGESKRNQFIFNVSPRIGAGYGRIENVEDARQAVYIANALSKRNILSKNNYFGTLFNIQLVYSLF